MKNGKWKMENVWKIFLLVCALSVGVFAQTTEPKPSAAKSVKVPTVKETKLKNGLTVAVAERKNVPLVTVQLLIKSGAELENLETAGLTTLTAELLTKGTKTRNATQIAEQMEFLGATLNSGANYNSTFITVNVMSDKLDQAMAILADTALNPSFDQKELDLLKSQTLDGLNYNLTQPGFLANYIASVYSFSKHPTGGTVESITKLSKVDIAKFHKDWFNPDNSILIFTGDITAEQANKLAMKYFGSWKKPKLRKELIQTIEEVPSVPEGITTLKSSGMPGQKPPTPPKPPIVDRILVIDLPNSGQAAVSYAQKMGENSRIEWEGDNDTGSVSQTYYPAIVLNSLLGGGYSSRLNQEIRIKRGLSYGAGSSFAWQWYSSDFSTRTQTKNESAAQVAELVIAEINKLSEGEIPETELNPRRLVLTGGFGRNIETNQGLAIALAELYSFTLPAETLNSYMSSVLAVNDKQLKQFAAENFEGGDIIIVGDYSVFKDDLAKRFPNMDIEVIKAVELDITKENLRK